MLEEMASWERRRSAIAEPSDRNLLGYKSAPLAKNQLGLGLAVSQLSLQVVSNSNGVKLWTKTDKGCQRSMTTIYYLLLIQVIG